jgi:hypothetical protein
MKSTIANRIQGSRSSTFLFSVSINTALNLLEIPDPAYPFPDNRRVSKKHAMDFGNYWEKHFGDWVVPPLLIDSVDALKFKSIQTIGPHSEIVELDLGDSNSHSLRILDGQHRILGWYLKKIELDARLAELISKQNKANISGDRVALSHARKEIVEAREVIERLDSEYITINLIDSLSPELHKQFFVDIAKNALGINKTVQSKFDSASVINRVTQNLIKNHPLFKGRIDMEKTSCSGSNPHLLTVVNVADITRHACFGVNARVTERRENVYKDKVLEKNVIIFLDALVKNVPQLRSVVTGDLSPVELRDQYLLGSGTIWRCLAGAFYETCVTNDDVEGVIDCNPSRLRKFEKFLRMFSEQMTLPISRSWFATTLFPTRKSKAPSSRAQDLDAMVGLMSAYAVNGQMFVPRNPTGL